MASPWTKPVNACSWAPRQEIFGSRKTPAKAGPRCPAICRRSLVFARCDSLSPQAGSGLFEDARSPQRGDHRGVEEILLAARRIGRDRPQLGKIALAHGWIAFLQQ